MFCVLSELSWRQLRTFLVLPTLWVFTLGSMIGKDKREESTVRNGCESNPPSPPPPPNMPTANAAGCAEIRFLAALCTGLRVPVINTAYLTRHELSFCIFFFRSTVRTRRVICGRCPKLVPPRPALVLPAIYSSIPFFF